MLVILMYFRNLNIYMYTCVCTCIYMYTGIIRHMLRLCNACVILITITDGLLTLHAAKMSCMCMLYRTVNDFKPMSVEH